MRRAHIGSQGEVGGKVKAPAHLGTLADQQGAKPKPTRLDAMAGKENRRRDNEAKLREWRKAVDARDGKQGFKCRWSGKPLARTLELRPDRAERHHLEPRANRKTRYDVRNGVLCSLETHERFEHNLLQIVDGKTFVVDGRAYWDADHKLKVLDVVAGISRWV